MRVQTPLAASKKYFISMKGNSHFDIVGDRVGVKTLWRMKRKLDNNHYLLPPQLCLQ